MTSTTKHNELRKVRSLEWVLRTSVTPRQHQIGIFDGGAKSKGSSSCSNFAFLSNGRLVTLSDLHPLDDDSNSSCTLSKLKLFLGSMILIGFVAVINYILSQAILAFLTDSSSISVLESEFDMYGLLSTEVILPLSLLMQGQTHTGAQTTIVARSKPKRRMKRSHGFSKTAVFGYSAAIASIIDLVGPLLPFAGGLDLRRVHLDLYDWFKSFIGRNAYFMDVSRDLSSSSSLLVSRNNKSNQDLQSKHMASQSNKSISSIDKNSPLILGASKPFLSLNEIAELNLEEIALAFQLSTNSHLDTTIDGIKRSLRPQMHHLMQAIQNAASSTRGGILPASTTTPKSQPGNIDASLFLAALRIFAEWRMLRTVPEGYKSYSVGMALGLKDVVQNIAKVEVVLRDWINDKIDSNDTKGEHAGPTIRQLLQYELSQNLHPNLPRLNGGAAIGLLWSLRQLLYQSAVFQNILDTPDKFNDSKDAVGAAYESVYGGYHGWAVKKIFNYSFRSAPEASLIFNIMDTHKLREITNRAKGISADHDCTEDDLDNRSELHDTELSETETAGVTTDFLAELAFWGGTINTSDSFQTVVDPIVSTMKKNNWVDNLMHHTTKIIEHIDNEFSKVGQLFAPNWGDVKLSNKKKPITDPQKEKKYAQIITTRSNHSNTSIRLQGPELEMYISQEMEKHIRSQISHYLQLMKHVTFDLEELFDELNMNDPSKV